MFKLWINLMLFVYYVEFFEEAFVSIGNYSEYKGMGINLDECGLRYVPLNRDHVTKCFQSPYSEREKRMVDNSPIERIFKGVDTKIGESPFTVFLSIRKSGREIGSCTGSLITFEWVMTAAHCFPRRANGIRKYNKVEVYAGSNQREEGEKIQANIDKLFVNPNYTVNDFYDIAVIKLFKKFTKTKLDNFGYLINSICLPERGQINDNEEKVTFFGYGFINQNKNPKLLQKGDAILEAYHPLEYRLIVLTKDNKPTSCLGDSGGPLVQYLDNRRNRAVLVGVTKGTLDDKPCSYNNIGSTFTPVSKNIDWLLESMLNN